MNTVKLFSWTSRFTTISFLSLVLVACGGGGGGSTPVNPPVSDTTAPVITLLGSASVDHEQGTTYTDEGATASDNVDGTVSVSTSGSVGPDAGTYTISYSASDAAGNTAAATRTVTVADTQPPTITLNGESDVSHKQGTSYVDDGATATDVVDGTVEVTTTGTVGTELGDYSLTFTAADSAGNTATEARTVTVIASDTPQAISQSVFDDGQANVAFDAGLNGQDSTNNWSTSCSQDGGLACPNLNWEIVQDTDRGDVLQIEHSSAGQQAIFFIKTNSPMDLSAYSTGNIIFDLKTVSGDSNYTMKIDCVYPCTSGDKAIGSHGTSGWETVTVSVADLVATGLQLVAVDTGIVIWATAYTNTIFQLDNVRWEGIDDGSGGPPMGGDDGWDIPDFTGYQSATSYEGYSQVWSDEFNGTTINTDDWGYDIGGGGWGNNELEFYTNRNAYLKDGQLVIRADKESYGGREYTSSRLKTQGKKNFQYGRIDIRARLPEGQGMWPALWMLGKNITEVSWPNSGEIDIMEMIGGSGRENTVNAHAWWSNSDGSNADYGGYKTLAAGETLASSYHVFSLAWTSSSLIWYIDDMQYHIMDITPAGLAAFQAEFFFIFNVAVGGNWPGNPNSSTVFPQRMVVDYVRVFQKD